MTAPNNREWNKLPAQMVPTTYPQYLGKLKCSCPAGALLQPASLPSATLNLGDIIADQARILSTFTSMYGLITTILKMIACIIEVLCCLTNPFCLIFAIINLFGTCLPDFMLIFPQFAIPAIIICVIKIIIAIVQYILEVIIPLILEIIANIEMLYEMFANQNEDAMVAIAFKIVSLFKELQNILGILSALISLFNMIKALLSAGIAIPCGGSSSGDQCPTVMQQSSLTGSDGILTVIYFSDDLYNFGLFFYSASNRLNLLTLRDFFPDGINYNEVTDVDKLSYSIEIDGNTYAVKSVDSGGTASLGVMPSSYTVDGYLTNTDINDVALPIYQARMSVGSDSFQSLYAGLRYVSIQDTRGSSYTQNNGTWKIQTVYGLKDILIQKSDPVETWSYGAALTDIRWQLVAAAPSAGSNKTYSLSINHDILVKYDLISVGCHPAVKATKDALNNRFPSYLMNMSLPALPDLDAVIANINACVSAVVPASIDTQWVLDNYASIAENIGGLQNCIVTNLTSFQDDMVNYAKQISYRVMDYENSTIVAAPEIQLVGNTINIVVTPLDRNSSKLALGLPPGIFDVAINTNAGIISSTSEVLDDYGATTGEFIATLDSLYPITANISATIDGYDLVEFDGYALNTRYIVAQFITSTYQKGRDPGASIEPLGSGRSG
jgi:hypothetical protein